VIWSHQPLVGHPNTFEITRVSGLRNLPDQGGEGRNTRVRKGTKPVSTIKIAADGKPLFAWDGDKVAVEHILEKFPVGARHVGMTAQQFSDECIMYYFRAGSLISEDRVGREMQMMAVIWRILELETNNAEHPGKIADYVGSVDFDIDLLSLDQGFRIEVAATNRFHS
jgi:hypothetical protein